MVKFSDCTFAFLLAWLCLNLGGCVEEPSSVQHAEVATIQTEVGVHAVRFALPIGWQHLEQGSVQQLRGAGALLELQDLGSYSWSGIKAHIQQARSLSEQGKLLPAQERLKKLPDLQALFLETNDWHEIEHLWLLLLHRQVSEGKAVALASYDALLRAIAYQTEINFEAVTTRLLAAEDPHGQREEAERTSLQVSGRRALQVTTWHKLSHNGKKRYLYILNGNNILLLSVKLGADARYGPAFDTIVASLEIIERPLL